MCIVYMPERRTPKEILKNAESMNNKIKEILIKAKELSNELDKYEERARKEERANKEEEIGRIEQVIGSQQLLKEMNQEDDRKTIIEPGNNLLKSRLKGFSKNGYSTNTENNGYSEAEDFGGGRKSRRKSRRKSMKSRRVCV